MWTSRRFSLGAVAVLAATVLIRALIGADDPGRGLERLQHGVYQDPVLCSTVFDGLKEFWDGSDLEQVSKTSDVEVIRAIGRSRYGFAIAPYDNGGVPMGFVQAGTAWHMTCLLCHGGYVPGSPARPTIGVANNRLDLRTLYEDLGEYARKYPGRIASECAFPKAPEPAAETGEPMLFGLSVALERTPDGCHSATVNRFRGTTHAFIISASLLESRNKDLDRISPCEPIPDLVDHDLDAPAWWTTARKPRLYTDAFAPKDGRALLQFAMARRNPGALIRGWRTDANDMLAWINTLEAPRYAWTVDRTLAESGRAIFETNCARCHGTYGETRPYPALRADVGTDSLRLTGLPKAFKERYAASWLGHYGRAGVETSPSGFVAPPLNGVWATAPYFHNGAVPTLAHVLDSHARPVVWRVRDFDRYDRFRGGLDVEEFSEVPGGMKGIEKRRFIDSRVPGMHSSGHTFGDHLSAEQRKALIEYLKGL